MRKLGRNFLVWDSSCLVAYHLPYTPVPRAARTAEAKPGREARLTAAAGLPGLGCDRPRPNPVSPPACCGSAEAKPERKARSASPAGQCCQGSVVAP